MKEEILKNFSIFLDYAKQSVDFVKDQAPLYVQELIKYNICVYLFYSIICALFLFIGIILAIIAYKLDKKSYYEYEGIIMLCTFISITCIPTSIGLLVYNIKMFLTVYIAPRVFVMDYLLNLVKGN